MKITEERKGELIIYIEVFLWSFFPIVTVLTYKTLPALLSLAWGTLFSSLFFGAILLYRGKWQELWNVQLWKYTLFVAFYIGILFYSLIFTGLTMTTPGNAAVIGLFEVFTTFLFFNVFRGEHISREHIIGGVCMVLGAGLVLVRNFEGINLGDLLILAAVCSAPFGNFYQQRARKIASSESIMFLRTILSVPPLFLLAYFLGVHASFAYVQASIPLLLLNGVVLLGISKILWIEAIHRISVTKGILLNSIGPFLTLLFAWLILNQAPTMWQLGSLPLLIFGVLLLTGQFKFKTR